MSESPLAERLSSLRTPDGTTLVLAEVLEGEEVGPGPSFLLIHGLAQTRRAFELGPLPRLLLARGARVFLGELRGHGRSHGARPEHELEAYFSDDLPTLFAAIPGPIHYVGHSLGGILGYGALGRPLGARLASVTGVAAPLALAARRPDIRLLAALAGPLAARLDTIPLDRLLAGLARPLARAGAPFWLRAFQRYVGLTNPELASPAALEATLVTSHAESPAVFRALLAMAVSGRPLLLGQDLEAAVRQAHQPVAAIVGGRDVFAAPASVRGLAHGAGPRMVEVVEQGAHVDLTLGHHWAQTFARWWPFVTAPR